MMGRSDAVAGQGTQTVEPQPQGPDLNLEFGSVLARTMFELYRGTPVIKIDSPPGAGKTTTMVQLARQIMARRDVFAVVATPTRRGAEDIFWRAAEATADLPAEWGQISIKVSDIVVDRTLMPQRHLHSDYAKVPSPGNVAVRTVESCAWSIPACDVLIVDEAYQVPYATLLSAADAAPQVIMVGDPGQIGPVIPGNTAPWQGRSDAPHTQAPLVLAQHFDCARLSLPSTYRLGPVTTAAVRGFYDFPFDSARPDRGVVGMDEVTGFRLSGEEGPVGPGLAYAVADRVGALLTDATYDPGEGAPTRDLAPADIAVVVPNNNQLVAITALLTDRGWTGVKVGTANSLQGGEWPVVIAVDPLYGRDPGVEPTEFQTDPGRLCVMASRHSGNLIWVHDSNWRTIVGRIEDPEVAAKATALREAFLGT